MHASSVLGVDVGGTKVLVGLVQPDGTILERRRYPMNSSSQDSTLDSIEKAVADFLEQSTGPNPLAIGVGLVGQTNPQAGTWVQAINLPIHEPVQLALRLGERYSLPVAIDNDVHAAALAELRWGSGKNLLDFIYLNVGTGLAAGLVCGGQLVRGEANYAGEIGHMVVEPEGDWCACGQRGCLEPLASGGGMVGQASARLPNFPTSLLAIPASRGELTANHIFEAAEAGDPLAVFIADRAVRALGTALTSLIHALNPAAIVYGGGVVRDGWLMERVNQTIQDRLLPAARRSLKGIWASPLQTDQVGLLGAASLAWKKIEAMTHDR